MRVRGSCLYLRVSVRSCVCSALVIPLSFSICCSKRIFNVAAYREAIAVNQLWSGQPGRLVEDAPSYQVWSKQLPKGDVAVFVLNHGGDPVDVTIAAASISPSLTDDASARDIWNRTNTAPGLIKGGQLVVPKLASHDSVFYRFTPATNNTSAAEEPVWWPVQTAPSVSSDRPGLLLDKSATLPWLGARGQCERIRTADACAELTPCEQRCAAAGHCCAGTTSGSQHPSCAQGCIVAKNTTSVKACEAVCDSADGKCEWTFGSVSMNNCGSCLHPTPSTECCNGVVKDECKQGCSFANYDR